MGRKSSMLTTRGDATDRAALVICNSICLESRNSPLSYHRLKLGRNENFLTMPLPSLFVPFMRDYSAPRALPRRPCIRRRYRIHKYATGPDARFSKPHFLVDTSLYTIAQAKSSVGASTTNSAPTAPPATRKLRG